MRLRLSTRKFAYLKAARSSRLPVKPPASQRPPPRPGGAIDPEANEIVEGNGEQDDADVQFLAIGVKGKAEGEQDEIAQVIRGRKVEKQQNG